MAVSENILYTSMPLVAKEFRYNSKGEIIIVILLISN
jgi:hypothetical protein